MRIKARALGHRRRGLLQRQGARGHRPPLHRRARAARGFLGHARQGHGVVAAGRPHATTACTGPLVPSLLVNEFVFHEKQAKRRSTRSSRRSQGKTALLQTLKDYTHQKNNVWGITARNREQNFALNLLMNPEIDFVTLLGQAGTGKTLLDARRRPDADARVQGLHRDHHDARHRAGRRGHRLPARHRGREDEAVDGRARGQPRRAQQDRRRGRRMGPRRDARPDPLAHQGEERSTSCAAARSSTST